MKFKENKKMSAEAIKKFREEVKQYRGLLFKSAGPLLDIKENHNQLSHLKSSLIKQLAVLENVIAEYSRQPMYRDPYWNVTIDAYQLALSSDILQRRGPALDAIIDDLDYIEAKVAASPKKALKQQKRSLKNPAQENKRDKPKDEYSINEGVN